MMKKILKALPVAFVIFLLMGSACAASVNEKFDGFTIPNTYDSYYDGDVNLHIHDNHGYYGIIEFDDDTDIKFNDNEKSVWL